MGWQVKISVVCYIYPKNGMRKKGWYENELAGAKNAIAGYFKTRHGKTPEFIGKALFWKAFGQLCMEYMGSDAHLYAAELRECRRKDKNFFVEFIPIMG